MNSGIPNTVLLLVGLALAGCFSVEAASLKHARSPMKQELGVVHDGLDKVLDKTADDSDDDIEDDNDVSTDSTQAGPQAASAPASAPGGLSREDDEEKEETPHAYEVMRPARTAEEVRLAKAEQNLAANLREQSELQSKLKHLGDESKSEAEIDASVKLVANETESVAMADMLGHVWKEMRMFETPFYVERMQEELQHLKLDERALEDNVTASQSVVSASKDELAQKNVTASSEEETEAAEVAKKTKKIEAAPDDAKVISRMNFWAMDSSKKKSIVFQSLLYLLSGILAAYLFQQAAVRYPGIFVPQLSRDKYPNPKDFSNHIFGFLGDRNLCMLGCFCPCLTWASTLDRKGLLSYWKAFFAFFVLALLNAYTMGVSTLCVVVLGVYYRQKLRASYEMENGTVPTVAMDFLLWCCCQPCAIIQEAREEGVTRGGTTIEGP